MFSMFREWYLVVHENVIDVVLGWIGLEVLNIRGILLQGEDW